MLNLNPNLDSTEIAADSWESVSLDEVMLGKAFDDAMMVWLRMRSKSVKCCKKRESFESNSNKT